jgi:hypothetical protein
VDFPRDSDVRKNAGLNGPADRVRVAAHDPRSFDDPDRALLPMHAEEGTGGVGQVKAILTPKSYLELFAFLFRAITRLFRIADTERPSRRARSCAASASGIPRSIRSSTFRLLFP